ncbi:nucleotidyltransferase family protein [Spirosoma pomorum]
MQPTLLILAAGMGSRYGGIKQLDQFGPNGETLMDYSLFDAYRAGFRKVVFIIREELRSDFMERFEKNLEGKLVIDYAIQSLNAYVPDALGEINRLKPWGTGHAMLCAKEYTRTPFAIINADDYYGVESFQIIYDFLTNDLDPQLHALVGYAVKNTLSPYGSVSRGVCKTEADGRLESVVERTQIYSISNGTESERIVYEEENGQTFLDPDTPVSMNFWGFKPDIFPLVQQQFEAYATMHAGTPKAEFYIPTVVSQLLNTHTGSCRVFQSPSIWFGVTYPADKPLVQHTLSELHRKGVYPRNLW